MFHCCKG